MLLVYDEDRQNGGEAVTIYQQYYINIGEYQSVYKLLLHSQCKFFLSRNIISSKS